MPRVVHLPSKKPAKSAKSPGRRAAPRRAPARKDQARVLVLVGTRAVLQ